MPPYPNKQEITIVDYRHEYRRWLDNVGRQTQDELAGLDEAEIQDRFYRALEFGTGGLRGAIGAGVNRMNRYVVGQVTQGLATWLLAGDGDAARRGVAIAYDCRNLSPEFAEEVATVLAANGIKAYLFDSLRPTPELSFTVRHLGCAAGIVITASHNPAKDNGYKVYGPDGSQITQDAATAILAAINGIDIFRDVKRVELETARQQGRVEIIGDAVDRAYLDCVKQQSVNPALAAGMGGEYTLVYTPLHGSGNRLVRQVLNEMGFKRVIVVTEQEQPDGNFPTVKSPNPEEKAGFALAVEYARQHDAELILATDPDADRVGIMVKTASGDYVNMTGNQVGVLLTEYIASRGKPPKNGMVIKTIVTTDMVKAVCKKRGLAVMEVLTGFKYIGEKIMEFERDGGWEFVFGFEESYGYLKGTYARDKDAVVASLLIAEMALYYRKRGLTLHEQMQVLYRRHGYYLEDQVSFTMAGSAGLERIGGIMGALRSDGPAAIGGKKVLAVRDYKLSRRVEIASGRISDIALPKSNVLYFELKGGGGFVVRPSGTEPKIKFYLMARGKTQADAETMVATMRDYAQMVYDKALANG